jgi:hypothetical protein
MATRARSCPLTRSQVVDLYYLEHRARAIDIAAFLDRVDRAQPDGKPEPDFRIAALKRALQLLSDGQPQRARRVLLSLSDPTSEPIASAAGMKGAAGAWPGAADQRSGIRDQRSRRSRAKKGKR